MNTLLEPKLASPNRLRLALLSASLVAALMAQTDKVYAGQTWTVKNCDDSGPDSLRDDVRPGNAQAGDIIDLGQLSSYCGTADSVITLSSGEIAIGQGDLTIQGPEIAGSVTISGGGASRIFYHQGGGTLRLRSLTLRDGYYRKAGGIAAGGCVLSTSNVYLFKSNVAHCVVADDTGYAHGGGIRTSGDLTLVRSTISNSEAGTPLGSGTGGGAWVGGTLTSKYSTLTSNAAHFGASGGLAGAAYAFQDTVLIGSTIDGNKAAQASALVLRGDSVISNSTISGNIADDRWALRALAADSLSIDNTTIANNQSSSEFENSRSAALYFRGTSANSPLVVESSIIAGNTAASTFTPSDIYVSPALGILSGADNLVIASNTSPSGVITVQEDPQLGPLQMNGGWTRTHALSPQSPAIGKGNNAASHANDQRGNGYPRTSGPNSAVDIGAVQFDTIFAATFEFE